MGKCLKSDRAISLSVSKAQRPATRLVGSTVIRKPGFPAPPSPLGVASFVAKAAARAQHPAQAKGESRKAMWEGLVSTGQ